MSMWNCVLGTDHALATPIFGQLIYRRGRSWVVELGQNRNTGKSANRTQLLGLNVSITTTIPVLLELYIRFKSSGVSLFVCFLYIYTIKQEADTKS